MEFLTVDESSVIDLRGRIRLAFLWWVPSIFSELYKILIYDVYITTVSSEVTIFQSKFSAPHLLHFIGSTVSENVSILDVFLKKEHFARNIVHCLRYFGSFNRQHIVYLCLLLLKCNGPHGRLTILSMMDILQLIKNYLSD